jgi:hypothetical protein
MNYIFLAINIYILILFIVINTCRCNSTLILTIFNISFVILILSINVFEKYDYQKENPNALVKGKNISGTVYSNNEENTPGLGWIL